MLIQNHTSVNKNNSSIKMYNAFYYSDCILYCRKNKGVKSVMKKYIRKGISLMLVLSMSAWCMAGVWK